METMKYIYKYMYIKRLCFDYNTFYVNLIIKIKQTKVNKKNITFKHNIQY